MQDSFTFLLLLLIAHVLADFYFQPKKWVESRNELHFLSYSLYFHVLVHGAIIFLITYIYTQNFCISMQSSIFILITHYIIDLAKSYLPQTVSYFIADQVLHIIALFIVWLSISSKDFLAVTMKIIDLIDYKVLIVAFAYLIIWKPVSIFVSMVLKKWDLEDPQSDNQESLPSAGDAIGRIERVLILTFILCNQLSGIGFLLAAKSVFRFGDLTKNKEKKLTEYVMLGTLTSVAVTIIVGLIMGHLIGVFPHK